VTVSVSPWSEKVSNSRASFRAALKFFDFDRLKESKINL